VTAELRDFVLSGPAAAAYVDTVELSHVSWSQSYRVVRNVSPSLDVVLEDLSPATFTYYPLNVNRVPAKEGLNLEFEVNFGDLGGVLPAELDRMRAAGTLYIRPTIKYRVFRSDSPSTGPIIGPWEFEVYTLTFSISGATLAARTRASSSARTGILYTARRFATIRSA